MSLGPASNKNALKPAFVTVGTSAVKVVDPNPSRTGLVLTNTNASGTISLSFGNNEPVSGSGITIEPGQQWKMDESAYTTAVVKAIGSTTSLNLAIQEFC